MCSKILHLCFTLITIQKVIKMLKSKIYPIVILTALGLTIMLIWASCKKDVNAQRIDNQSNCVLSMNFEIETTTTAHVVNPTDEERLAPIDRIMALPHRERYAVEVCYKSDNRKEFSMTVLTPENPITYPNNVADGYIKPDYHRLTVADGMSKYYDQNNNLIRSSPYESDVNVVKQIVDMVANKKSLTAAEFTQGLNIMRDSGMIVQYHQNNLASIRLDNPDGSYCIQVLDKTTQAAIGNFYYDNTGKLQSRSMLNIEGTAEQPIVKHAYFESRYTSVEGEIPMWVQQYSKFDHFSLNLQ